MAEIQLKHTAAQIDETIEKVRNMPEQGVVGPQGPKGEPGAQGIQGPAGVNGKSLEYIWRGTELGIRQEGQSEYTYVNLQGPQGLPGSGGDGGSSREIEIQKGETHIQWRYVGESSWRNLVSLEELKGTQGEDGITPNIAVGTVTTLEAGQKATVTRKGTNENPVFDFGIPKGADGIDGGSADLSNYQTKTDETLNTTSKTIVGAINENSAQFDNIATDVTNLDERVTFIEENGTGGFATKILTSDEIAVIIGAGPIEPPIIEVQSITASVNYININVGETRKITYTILPSNATDKTVTFESSDPLVCSVDQEGNIKALKSGEISITLTASNGVSTDCQVVINELSEVIDVTEIKLNSSSLTLNIDETFTLIETITPSTATNKSVVWESDNSDIAVVDNGVVTGIAVGTCSITCKSVSNPNISVSCNLKVKEATLLTSVTNGLIHSYDFTNLNGDSASIEDLSGNVPCTMSGFTDIAGAKTELGIKCEGSGKFINQGNLLDSYNNLVTICATFIGEDKTSQGYYGLNGIKLCKHNSLKLNYTHTAYLARSFCDSCHNVNTYSTFISQFDFNNSKIMTYVNGIKVNEVSMDDKVSWSNSIKIFDGYSSTNVNLLTVKNLCIYNRLLSDEECVKVSNDLVNGCRYINKDFNKSTITNKNGVIYQIGDTSVLDSTNLSNIVSITNDVLTNVLSKNNDGFIVSDYATFVSESCINKTVITKFKYDSTQASSEQYISWDTNDTRIYIQNNKLYIRGTSTWYINGLTITLNNGYNIIRTENLNSSSFNIYLNGEKLTATINSITLFNDRLYNETLPIKDFIIIDRTLNESELSQLSNDLGGVV